MAGGENPFTPLARATGEQFETVLALNNAHAEQTSFLTADALRRMVGEAFRAVFDPGSGSFLIAFEQDAAYDSLNFLWFRERYDRFVYVDRIVVDPGERRGGLARAFYGALFEAAEAEGHRMVCCEVNTEPPNPGSERFHAAQGFEEVGTAAFGDKRVSYKIRPV